MLQTLLLAPLAGALINGLISAGLLRRAARTSPEFEERASAIIASLSVFAAAVCAAIAARGVYSGEGGYTLTLFEWFSSGSLSVGFSFVLDRLSAVMALVITFVGFLIHVYSAGYMKGDRAAPRYFALLGLFVFFMLILVLGSGFVVMFAGWEGVGFVSYLLIGFWFNDEEKARAGRKAFIVNRVGDFGFLLGMFLIFTTLGSLEFSDVFAAAPGAPEGVLAVACLLLFFGAAGKSAQFPLHVWLPDAMAGPTPVSALIHAATMVTAGIYMVARCSALFAAAPMAQYVVLTVAVLTALGAACAALTQSDIKKALAYSTVSQLGFMFMAAGAGAGAAAIFHLVTHAFFKALLFLGAGSVIHSLGGIQDMGRMGGLRRAMPVTALTFLAGTLAISGVPFFAGFFSKDSILAAVYDGGFTVHWGAGVLAAMMTAFYMTRVYVRVFEGAPGADTSGAHESPPVMTVPLVCLALLSVFGGLLSVPHFLSGALPVGEEFLAHFLEPVVGAAPYHQGGLSHYALAVVSTVAAFVGIASALFVYTRGRSIRERAEKIPSVMGTKGFSRSGFRLDEFYNSVFVEPFRQFSKDFAVFDISVVDGAVNGSAWLAKRLAVVFSMFQTGLARAYVAAMVAFVVILVFVSLNI